MSNRDIGYIMAKLEELHHDIKEIKRARSKAIAGYIMAKLEELHHDIKEIKRARSKAIARISSLERSRAYMKGIGGVLAVTTGVVLKYIHGLIGG
jgi:DNA-binding protein